MISRFRVEGPYFEVLGWCRREFQGLILHALRVLGSGLMGVWEFAGLSGSQNLTHAGVSLSGYELRYLKP